MRDTTLLLASLASLTAFACAEEQTPPSIIRYVAVDNVCAWPQLATLPNGTIGAILHNQATHGLREGDVELWKSAGGEFWRKIGTPTKHEPQTIRMNHAFGLAKNGDMLVLCSGWTDLKQPQRPKQTPFRDDILRTWVCRSTDGGVNWTERREFHLPEQGWTEFIPFGPIIAGDDGALHASCYAGDWVDPAKSTKTRHYRSWHFRSDDDGATWRPASVIGPKHNETSLLHLGGKRWLAAARIDATEIFRSDDDGNSWQGPQRVTERNEINAHLARLKDGRLLLTYGCRVKEKYGVLAKLSGDDGATWGEPIRLAHSLQSDCGYPSSVQREDGKIVTAFYTKAAMNHERYHMGVAIWETPAAK